MIVSRWRAAFLYLCLLGSVSAEESVWDRLKAGTYKGQNSIQLYMLFDTIWEWTQVEADIDRLEAKTVQMLRIPAAQYYAEMGGSAMRNLMKLWISWRACAGGPNDDKKEDGVTREITPFAGVLLGAGVGANATHAWLRKDATHMSDLDEELFTAYNRRLTSEQKARLALVQKKLRRESGPFKLGLRLVPTRNNVWQFKNGSNFEKSSKVLGCLLLDTLFTIRFRKRRADYIDTILREAHMQYDPIKAKLEETHRRLAARELQLAQLEAAEANGEEQAEPIAEVHAAAAVLRARHKELHRHEQLLRGLVPGIDHDDRSFLFFDNDEVTRQISLLC